jgi:hypothetical protein
MRLPTQSAAVVRNPHAGRVDANVDPSGCSVLKKIACGGAILACGAVCVGSLGTACVECLAGIGASGCIDCF